MIKQSAREGSQCLLALSTDKTQRKYQPPKLTFLELSAIESGINYLQESDNGGGNGFMS